MVTFKQFKVHSCVPHAASHVKLKVIYLECCFGEGSVRKLNRVQLWSFFFWPEMTNCFLALHDWHHHHFMPVGSLCLSSWTSFGLYLLFFFPISVWPLVHLRCLLLAFSYTDWHYSPHYHHQNRCMTGAPSIFLHSVVKFLILFLFQLGCWHLLREYQYSESAVPSS